MELENASPLVQVTDLTKRYGETTAVNGLSFSIKKGEIVGLLGANGAGKTTTMHMLLGILSPTSGKVEMFGQDMQKHRLDILKRCNFSSTYASLPSNLKVWQNLTVFGQIYGVRNLKEKIDTLLEQFEISDFKKSITGHLSSGESTRLNLCKAMLNDPELLLLDEPTASLDPDIADKVRKILLKIQRERQLSILYTSHNMKDIEEICDRVIFVQKGVKVTDSKPQDILDKYGKRSLEDVFIRIARSGEVVEEENNG